MITTSLFGCRFSRIDAATGRKNDPVEIAVIVEVVGGRTTGSDIDRIVLTADQSLAIEIKDLLRRVRDVRLGKGDLQRPPGFSLLDPRFDLFTLDTIPQQGERQCEVSPHRVTREIG